ncbi:MAG TPA: S24 family peptidase [Armatimonadota bacterium]|jgi:hypothetical protein
MSAYSARFGELLGELLRRKALSYGQASVRLNGAVSPSYWSTLRQGRIPSRSVIQAITDAFPEEDLSDLWVAAGYAPPGSEPRTYSGSSSPIEVPPGAKWLTEDDTPLPVGPSASADSAKDPGDLPPVLETINLGRRLIDAGANYTLRVDGDCLSPHVQPGDLVAIRLADGATDGRIVVARLRENQERGELGGGYTLKIWHPNGPTEGFYRADGSMAFRGSEAEIVGVVEQIMHASPPVVKLKRHKPSRGGERMSG